MTDSRKHSWLLLIHQLPPKPDYLRVKIRRRLQKIGSVPIKNTVYVLPDREDTLEDFHWLLEEIRRDGGEGTVCSAGFIEGLADSEVIRLFNEKCDEAYSLVAKQARELRGSARARHPSPETTRRVEMELARLRRTLAEIAENDFFKAPGRKSVQRILEQAQRHMVSRSKKKERGPSKRSSRRTYSGRTWVTRANIFVDRMASAWLIKRFVDRRARFKFVDPARYLPNNKELPFDMFDGEFTHRGDQCTFEVLCAEFGVRNAVLAVIAEVVHDVDLKDGKFGREEAPGIALALRGIRSKHVRDVNRMAAGFEFFDALYNEIDRDLERRRRG